MVGVFSGILFVATPQNITFVVVTKGMWYNALNCFCKFLRLVFVLVNTVCKALDEVIHHQVIQPCVQVALCMNKIRNFFKAIWNICFQVSKSCRIIITNVFVVLDSPCWSTLKEFTGYIWLHYFWRSTTKFQQKNVFVSLITLTIIKLLVMTAFLLNSIRHFGQ